jgi:hypothetical protein
MSLFLFCPQVFQGGKFLAVLPISIEFCRQL